MKRRDPVYLQRKEDGRLTLTMEYLTWYQTRAMMRSGWKIVNGEVRLSADASESRF